MHHTVAEVVRFVEERIKGEDGKESRSLRGPYLARLELMHRLRERGCPEESLLGKTHRLYQHCRFTLCPVLQSLYMTACCLDFDR